MTLPTAANAVTSVAWGKYASGGHAQRGLVPPIVTEYHETYPMTLPTADSAVTSVAWGKYASRGHAQRGLLPPIVTEYPFRAFLLTQPTADSVVSPVQQEYPAEAESA